jgi:hypothetical protein
VPMPFGDDVFAVDLVHLCARFELRDVRTEAHGAALVDHAEL